MKKLTLILVFAAAFIFSKSANAQSFEGAPATASHYKALYMLDDSLTYKMQHILRNIDNALEDPRLKGKLEIELVVFGQGYNIYKKTGPHEQQLLALQKKGVVLAMCNNTMKAGHIERESLFPFVNYVPSGNGEIIIRGSDGWVVVHP